MNKAVKKISDGDHVVTMLLTGDWQPYGITETASDDTLSVCGETISPKWSDTTVMAPWSRKSSTTLSFRLFTSLPGTSLKMLTGALLLLTTRRKQSSLSIVEAYFDVPIRGSVFSR